MATWLPTNMVAFPALLRGGSCVPAQPHVQNNRACAACAACLPGHTHTRVQRCQGTRRCCWTGTPCACAARSLDAPSLRSTVLCTWRRWMAATPRSTGSSRCGQEEGGWASSTHAPFVWAASLFAVLGGGGRRHRTQAHTHTPHVCGESWCATTKHPSPWAGRGPCLPCCCRAAPAFRVRASVHAGGVLCASDARQHHRHQASPAAASLPVLPPL